MSSFVAKKTASGASLIRAAFKAAAPQTKRAILRSTARPVAILLPRVVDVKPSS